MSFKVWMKTGNILSYKSRCCASAWDLYDNYHATSDSGHLHKTWVCSTASLNWLNILFETSHVYLVVEIEIAVGLLSRAVFLNSINITKVINIGTNVAPRCIDRFVVNDLQSPKWNETDMHFTIITYVDFFTSICLYTNIQLSIATQIFRQSNAWKYGLRTLKPSTRRETKRGKPEL